jgi:hypothetical protein
MLRLNLLFLFLACALFSIADETAVFNWASPSSLAPTYAAPTSANRTGDYIGNVVFRSNGVELVICDNDVPDAADKARLVYNNYTAAPELRSNLYSYILITAPEGMDVSQVLFEGAKVGDSYLRSTLVDSSFKNGTWTAGSAASSTAQFDVISTINCSKITVICTQHSGVTDITTDNDANISPTAWFMLNGAKLTQRPLAPGVYVQQQGKSFKKIFVR